MVRPAGHVRREGRSWRLYYRAAPEPGQPRRQVSARLGDVHELPTAAAARRAADRFLAGADCRRLHAGTVMTWPSWCEAYRARYLSLLARGTRKTQASIIARHLVDAPALRELELHRIDEAAVQAFVLDQHAAGAAASTVRSRFALVRTMLRAAAASGLAVTPPRADRMRFPKNETAPHAIRAKAFTPAEVARILETATDPLRTAIALARYLGLRAGEVCGLTWDAIELATGLVELRQQAQDGALRPLKSRSSRANLRAPAPLLARLVAYRATWQPNPAGLLFAADDGRPLDTDILRRQLHRLLDELGIQRRGMHGFRHACALAMAAAGANPEAMRRAMRHAGIRTTSIYLSATPEDVAAALDAAANDGDSMGTEATEPQERRPSAHGRVIAERITEGAA